MRKKFTSYNDCINYLFNLERAGIKYDLKNIKSLLKTLGYPQNNFKAIHIAGTNGKGSVASILNSFLIEKKFKTGLYTSPHINDFRERILVNGKFISKNFIIRFVNLVLNEIDKIKPSFFEVTTAMAFEYFKAKDVDYAVIETGLGGRLDSTNVLKPVLSIITSLSIDHTDYLGKTIESITMEKGGIIKSKIPVISGNIPPVSIKILSKITEAKNSKIYFQKKNNLVRITNRTENGFYFNKGKEFTKIFFPTIGDFQLNNIAVGFSAMELLKSIGGINFNQTDIRNTFSRLKQNSNFHGRFEKISDKPKIVTDVSHNLQAIQNISSNLKYFKYKKLFIVFAMMADKNFKDCVNELSKLNAVIILTKPYYKRAAEPASLFNSVMKNRSKFIIKEDLANAMEYVFQKAGKEDLILITGSFFLVNDFLKLLHKG